MVITITLLLTTVIALVISAWTIHTNSKLRIHISEIAIEKGKLEERLAGAERECQQTIAAAEAERQRIIEASAEERDRITEAAKEEHRRQLEESELRFKNLANEILGSTQRTFKEEHETRLNEILKPLRDNIEQFKRTVTDSYSQEARERFSLQERIKELIELNQSIGREAKELSVALRGETKTQGDWGEMILETILEKSGMQRDREFTVQATRLPAAAGCNRELP